MVFEEVPSVVIGGDENRISAFLEQKCYSRK